MLPGLLGSGRHRASPDRHRTSARGRANRAGGRVIERRAFSALPSEVYARSVGLRRGERSCGPWLAGRAGGRRGHPACRRPAGVRPGAELAGHGRRRPGRSPHAARPGWRIPAASPAVSAVALNQVRLALRTPRGRATLLSPIVVFGLFAVMMVRSRSGMDFGPFQVESGLSLASFVAFVSLLSILPLAMNQFAIDRAGLTLAMLVPLETAALLRGKAIGNALIASIPAGICLAGTAIFFPSGDPMLWLCIPLDADLGVSARRAVRRDPVGRLSTGGRSQQHRPEQQRARRGRAARDAGLSRRGGAGTGDRARHLTRVRSPGAGAGGGALLDGCLLRGQPRPVSGCGCRLRPPTGKPRPYFSPSAGMIRLRPPSRSALRRDRLRRSALRRDRLRRSALRRDRLRRSALAARHAAALRASGETRCGASRFGETGCGRFCCRVPPRASRSGPSLASAE